MSKWLIQEILKSGRNTNRILIWNALYSWVFLISKTGYLTGLFDVYSRSQRLGATRNLSVTHYRISAFKNQVLSLLKRTDLPTNRLTNLPKDQLKDEQWNILLRTLDWKYHMTDSFLKQICPEFTSVPCSKQTNKQTDTIMDIMANNMISTWLMMC